VQAASLHQALGNLYVMQACTSFASTPAKASRRPKWPGMWGVSRSSLETHFKRVWAQCPRRNTALQAGRRFRKAGGGGGGHCRYRPGLRLQVGAVPAHRVPSGIRVHPQGIPGLKQQVNSTDTPSFSRRLPLNPTASNPPAAYHAPRSHARSESASPRPRPGPPPACLPAGCS
jgi:hypothetical protein